MMIQIGNPNDAVDPAVLDAPGGFAWWYADVITPDGDGLVLIWSYGLPFLPGYADGARRGRPERPASRPSVNVAVYGRGREAFYLLQEYPSAPIADADVQDVQVIGGCRFQTSTRDGRYTVRAELDCPLPGRRDRLTGTVQVDGTARLPLVHASDAPDAPHLWTPLAAPATANVRLQAGREPIASFSGRAYHDRNTGLVPLHDLGIQRWMWGRFPFADGERVCYLLWPAAGCAPRCIGLEFGSDGSTTEVPGLQVDALEERGAFLGLRHPHRLRLVGAGGCWMEVEHTATVDMAPFYARFQSRAVLSDGRRALGWSELCEPGRVDESWFRPLVRMRVHRTGQGNSFWLPLFNGSRRDRWRRLLRHALTSGW